MATAPKPKTTAPYSARGSDFYRLDRSAVARRLPTSRREGKPRSEGDPTIAWLQDAPVASADALARLGSKPLPPEPTPPPSGSNPFIWPRNETEFRQAMQSFADECYVGMLDPRTHVGLSSTLEISQPNHEGSAWGVNGNHAKVDWVGPVGDDMIRFRGVKGVGNRNLFVEKLGLFGNGYMGTPCGACLRVYAPEGDPGSFYKFTFRDIYASYGTFGLVFEGAVFEGMVENLHSENHTRDGFAMAHTYTEGEHQGIVSNVLVIHPNCSRNFGAGIRAVNSCNIIGGSFILNGEGGVVAPGGLRAAILCNGENTGESVFVIPHAGWGSEIALNEGSTDMATVARKYDNGQWVDVGKPLLFLLDGAADVGEHLNHVSPYGNATSPPVAVRKP